MSTIVPLLSPCQVSFFVVEIIVFLVVAHDSELSKCSSSLRCQLLCQGIQAEPHSSVFTDCFSYVGNVFTCLEEGERELGPIKLESVLIQCISSAQGNSWNGYVSHLNLENFSENFASNT